MSIKKEMLSKTNWAIYGISDDKEKFGYKIPEVMIKHGYNVVGINKKYAGKKILGIDVYASIDDVPHTIECIDVIVNPKISLSVIDEAIKNNIKNLWFQPHTFDEDVIKKAKESNIKFVDNDCVYAILAE